MPLRPMPLSRLRLRLSIAFALAFAAGLAVLHVALFLLLRRDADRQLTRRLQQSAGEMAQAMTREFGEAPTQGWRAAARETLREWPATPDAFVIYDSAGDRLAALGHAGDVATAPDAWRLGDAAVTDRRAGDHDLRLAVDRPPDGALPAFRVLAIGAREATEQRIETLGWWLVTGAPLVVLLSLVGGYLLARLALRPIGALEQTVARLDPSGLGERLPVHDPADELDRLARQFNGMLYRLEQAQLRNRRFVQRAAHQLKTPLTVVLGEADLSLGGSDDTFTSVQGMRRVRTAAHQMRRRVDELLLLAEAQAGEPAPLDDLVELDGLALECADLMRGRAAQTSHGITLGGIEPITVRGSARLLREALMELIENACRHATREPDIRISVYADGDAAWLAVAGGGPPVAAARLEVPPADENARLGLTIVRWIAGQHGGRLEYQHAGGVNIFALSLSLSPPRRVSASVSRAASSGYPASVSQPERSERVMPPRLSPSLRSG
ncbi:MAG TPA: HAMP domain-containing protein [Gemmatimonadales bacterium]|nr:HAMP domain-containing protein [Gemmatimonadales bacterium]